ERITEEGWTSPAAGLLILFAIVLAPPLEEITFRGFLQPLLVNSISRHFRWVAIVTTAVIFTAVHGFAWFMVPGFMVLALGLGILCERRGSLVAPIAMHTVFNLFNVLMAIALTRLDGL